MRGSQQPIEIGSGPVTPVAPSQPIEERLHGSTFIHKAANVSLRLGQTDSFREGLEGLLLLLVHLARQGL